MSQLLNTSFRIFYVVLFIGAFSMCKKNIPKPLTPDEIVETEPPDLIAVTKQVTESIGGYYIALPKHFSTTRKTYPVLIFMHGLGQTGNGSTDLNYLLNDGIGKLLNDHTFPPSFTVKGKSSSFIVVSPQYSKEPSKKEMLDFNTYIMITYRGDIKHLYMSGLSLGARLTTLLAAEYPNAFAAIVPLAGVPINPGIEERCKAIAAANLPVWEFHNQDDPLANIDDAKSFIELITGFNPTVLPRMTIFKVYGHDAWTTALNPDFKEDGMNIYEWMLSYSR